MSATLVTLAMQTGLDPVPRFVLVALAHHANDDGSNCFPSVGTIMNETGYGERAVRGALRLLRDETHISFDGTPMPGRATRYLVHPQVAQTDTPAPYAPPAQSAPLHSVHPPLHEVQGTLHRVQGTPARGANRTVKVTVKEQPTNSQGARPTKGKASKPPKSDEPPPSSLDMGAWHRWEQYRSQIRKPIKQPSIAAAQRQLAGYGADQPAVVEQSIAQGWQGLFPLKNAGPQRQGSGAPPKQTAMSRLLGNLGKPAPRAAGDDDAIDGDFFPVPA